MNATLVRPPATVTSAGTTDTPSLDSVTAAPVMGASAVSVTTAVTFVPPTTLDGLSVIDAICDAGETVSAGDCRLLPFNDAVIVALPTVTPHTANVAVVDP